MTKRTSIFTAVLIAVASLAAGLVLASRLDLTSTSSAQPMALPDANSEPINGGIDATTFRRIAQAVSPAVVSIQTESRRPQRGPADFFDQNPFFGNPRRPQAPGTEPPPQISGGTGFIIDTANGYILTNNHVVEGATRIQVGFFGDHRLAELSDAKVVGRDPLTDSALIQLTNRPNRQLAQIRFGDSDQMAPGDWVVAIGNPFGLRHTVTVGVVSAVGRDDFAPVAQRRQEMIQTDAAINRGNSGGPLLNVRGEVIGINTAIYTNDPAAGNVGIGFAVPINSVRTLLPQLRTGRIVRGQLGVQVNITPLTEQEARDFGLPGRGGALITVVNEGSAAEKAGLRVNDIVIEYNGQPVNSSDDLISRVVQTPPGTTVPVKIVRHRQQRTVNVTVDELDLLAEDTSEAPRQARRGTEAGGVGITIEPITPAIARQLDLPAGQAGVVVRSVAPGSEAARANVREGDVIVEVNGREVRNVDDAARAIEAVPQGSAVLLTVIRQGREQGLMVRKR
jgi:serine protease Do